MHFQQFPAFVPIFVAVLYNFYQISCNGVLREERNAKIGPPQGGASPPQTGEASVSSHGGICHAVRVCADRGHRAGQSFRRKRRGLVLRQPKRRNRRAGLCRRRRRNCGHPGSRAAHLPPGGMERSNAGSDSGARNAIHPGSDPAASGGNHPRAGGADALPGSGSAADFHHHYRRRGHDPGGRLQHQRSRAL